MKEILKCLFNLSWFAPDYVVMFPPQIIYKMEYNKTKAKGYTLPFDTPHQQHMKKVKDITSNVSPLRLAASEIWK